MDPMGNQGNNLQKRWEAFFVKDKIIPDVPDCPKQSAHSNSNKTFFLFRNLLEI
jgi:hypothetical protein